LRTPIKREETATKTTPVTTAVTEEMMMIRQMVVNLRTDTALPLSQTMTMTMTVTAATTRMMRMMIVMTRLLQVGAQEVAQSQDRSMTLGK
jgi:hypothetical protein